MNIQDMTLDEDIEATQKEYEAYKKIAEGFKTLSTLDFINQEKYSILQNEYFIRQKECSLVLDELYKLKLKSQ